MKNTFFWNTRAKSDRLLIIVFIIVTCLAALWMLTSHLLGFHHYLDWNTLAETEKISIMANEFTIGPFKLTQTVNSEVFYQKFDGTFPRISPIFYFAFSVIIAVAFTVLVTLTTSFSKYWYFISISILTLFLATIKLELLLLFDSSEKIGLVIGMLLYLPVSYYFNRINPAVSLVKRLVVFGFITFFFAIFLFYSSSIPDPFYYLATSLNTPATIITLVFILTVGHEIVAFFVYLLFGKGESTTKNGFTHFIVITVIYLSNVLIGYLHEVGMIDWDIVYINVFLLLLISGILGFWGFKHRENQYDFIMPFRPIGAILYLVLGFTSFATIGYFYSIGNDPGIEIITDFIFYAHLAYGLIFILYFLGNFIGLIKSKLPIYKVIYKPTGMPYFTFRFAALIVVIALVLRTNWQVPVFQNTASSLNSIADYHLNNGEYPLAERYYTEASEYALNNHKSNYAIAAISERNKNVYRALTRYQEAIQKWPSPQAYLKLANLYKEENRFFDALFVLKEASHKFPNNSKVLNGLALLYGTTNLIDSAVYFLDKSFEIDKNSAAPSNIIAALAANEFQIAVDSVKREYQISNDPVSLNNTMGLSNINQSYGNFSYTQPDSLLSTLELALIKNSSINALFLADTFNTENLYGLANYDGNAVIKQDLEFIRCLHLYKNGRVNDAFRSLNWTATTTEKIAAKYFNDIGLWALQEGAPDVAYQYFQWADERSYEDAKYHMAIAATEDQNRDAIQLWQNIKSYEPQLSEIADKMTQILVGPMKESWNDNDKYLYTRYALTYADTVEFKLVLGQINDANYKAASILIMAKKAWDRDLNASAIDIYNKITDLKITDASLFEDIQFFELNMLASQQNIRGLANKINQDIEFTEDRLTEKALYTALIADASNDSTKAFKNYSFIARRNPFFEEAIIAAANYFNRRDPFRAYSDLLSAIEVNPNSIKLVKAFILQSARVQQNTSGEYMLTQLQKLVSEKEYELVENQYEEIKKLREEEDLG